MARRILILLVALLAGIPWAALPGSAEDACVMGMPEVDTACSYCAPESRPAAVPTVSAQCCSYAANDERGFGQARGVSFTPRPDQSPEAPAATPVGSTEVSAPNAVRFARTPEASISPHAPPTATTHLLL